MSSAVLIDPNGLTASIVLPAGVGLPMAELRTVITQAGICHGLLQEGLRQATVATDEERTVLLAVGRPARGPTPAGLVPALDEEHVAHPVLAGQVIGTFEAAQTPRTGMRVTGEDIPAPDDLDPTRVTPLGEGLGVIADEAGGGEVTVERDGYLYRDDQGAAVVRTEWPGEKVPPALQLSKDGMEAWLDLPPHAHVGKSSLMQALSERKVRFGISKSGLMAALHPSPVQRQVVVARGRERIDAQDAEVRWLVPPGPGLRFRDVHAGDVVARRLPPTEPIDGMTVLGQALAATPGEDCDLQSATGEGLVHVDTEHGEELRAEMDGVCVRSGSRLSVSAELTIPGDLNVLTGNVDTVYDVVVQGDINTGVTVKSGGTITVGGVIEDARVSAQGDLIVRGGIVSGRHRVKAHGRLEAAYLNHRTVKCGDCEIRGEVTNTSILATGAVRARRIVGGEIIAAGDVTVEEIGSHAGTRTSVRVGVDPFRTALHEEAARRLPEARREAMNTVERAHAVHQHLKRVEDQLLASPSAERQQEVHNIRSEYRRARRIRDAAAVRRDQWELALDDTAVLEAHPACVRVRRKVFPGTEITIGRAAPVLVDSELTGSTFGENARL